MTKEVSNVNSIVDSFFRTEYGRVISYLSSKYGKQHFERIEDAVQEAIYMAMKTWPFKTIPDNPSAWIFRVANNKMIDKLRRLNKVEVPYENENVDVKSFTPDFESISNDFSDEMLQMMFTCCHPSLSIEYQIILSLKILGGFGIKEIASSLMKSEAAVAKAYTRARQKFVEENIKLEVPVAQQIESRLKVVLKIIYLLFNEGYKTSAGAELYKVDLCHEAIRLNKLLIDHESTNTPNVHALIALMLLHMARFESRVGFNGELITLENQDRSLWNKDFMSLGMYHINQSLVEGHHSEYHIQAAISALHCQAKTFEATNWTEMLLLYDAMIKINPSPVTNLNRLIPLSKTKGVEVAYKKLSEIESSGFFSNYYLFYVIKGQFEFELGKKSSALDCYEKAISLTENIKEKQFLAQKMAALN